MYSWGNELIENKQCIANVWEEAQFDTQSADGFIYASPVGFLGSTPVGLTDMRGNVRLPQFIYFPEIASSIRLERFHRKLLYIYSLYLSLDRTEKYD